MTAAVWRVRIGEHGWLRTINRDGTITVTGEMAEAFVCDDQAAARRIVANLPSNVIPGRAVPGPPPAGGRELHGGWDAADR